MVKKQKVGLMQRLFNWAMTSSHKERTCPLCHVGTVVVEVMMDEWDDPIVKACTECGHKGD